MMMDNKGDGYVWLELRDNDNFETTATRVYGPEGLVSDLTHLQDKYYALNYLITTPEAGRCTVATPMRPAATAQCVTCWMKTATLCSMALAAATATTTTA